MEIFKRDYKTLHVKEYKQSYLLVGAFCAAVTI